MFGLVVKPRQLHRMHAALEAPGVGIRSDMCLKDLTPGTGVAGDRVDTEDTVYPSQGGTYKVARRSVCGGYRTGVMITDGSKGVGLEEFPSKIRKFTGSLEERLSAKWPRSGSSGRYSFATR